MITSNLLQSTKNVFSNGTWNLPRLELILNLLIINLEISHSLCSMAVYYYMLKSVLQLTWSTCKVRNCETVYTCRAENIRCVGICRGSLLLILFRCYLVPFGKFISMQLSKLQGIPESSKIVTRCTFFYDRLTPHTGIGPVILALISLISAIWSPVAVTGDKNLLFRK